MGRCCKFSTTLYFALRALLAGKGDSVVVAEPQAHAPRRATAKPSALSFGLRTVGELANKKPITLGEGVVGAMRRGEMAISRCKASVQHMHQV